jgi:hypothetical protein
MAGLYLPTHQIQETQKSLPHMITLAKYNVFVNEKMCRPLSL